MRLSELITHCRQRISDADKVFFKDVAIARELNLTARSLFRQKAAASYSYGQVVVDLSTTDNATQLRQVDRDEWVWMLPSWVYRVNEVRTRSGRESLGDIPRQTGDQRTGWSMTSNRGLLIKGNTSAQDLRLKVQKIPALVFRGTISVQSPDLGVLVVPSIPSTEPTESEPFPTDHEDGSLIGSQIEITSSSATTDPRGTIATVYSQTREYHVGTAQYQNYLEVAPRYKDHVKVGDTFESHPEIDEADVTLLILQTCEGLFQKDHNLSGQNVMRAQLERELVRFTNSLAPREGHQPHYIETADDTFVSRDPERDPSFG